MGRKQLKFAVAASVVQGDFNKAVCCLHKTWENCASQR
jgi:hypothetical protein